MRDRGVKQRIHTDRKRETRSGNDIFQALRGIA